MANRWFPGTILQSRTANQRKCNKNIYMSFKLLSKLSHPYLIEKKITFHFICCDTLSPKDILHISLRTHVIFSIFISRWATKVIVTISIYDWPQGKLRVFFPRDPQCPSRRKAEGNIEVKEKQNSMFPTGPVIKCFFYYTSQLKNRKTNRTNRLLDAG